MIRATRRAVRILIVDDHADSADLLARVLTGRVHEVAVSFDTDEALCVAREFKPDIAFLDVMIRCESGYLLARDLRELPDLTHCRFVAITGFVQDKHRTASEAAGFVRHLIKPLELDAVFEAIEAAMREHVASDGAVAHRHMQA